VDTNIEKPIKFYDHHLQKPVELTIEEACRELEDYSRAIAAALHFLSVDK
jgi:hypothetical protein